ncbi:hypothetical protein KCU91_g6210, partial [Aureobasidium melanogenum]
MMVTRNHVEDESRESRWINVGNSVFGAKTANAAARTLAELPLSFLITATHLDTTAKMRAKWRKKRVRRLKRKRRKTRARSK